MTFCGNVYEFNSSNYIFINLLVFFVVNYTASSLFVVIIIVVDYHKIWSSGLRCFVCISKSPRIVVCLILKDGFWVVHIAFGNSFSQSSISGRIPCKSPYTLSRTCYYYISLGKFFLYQRWLMAFQKSLRDHKYQVFRILLNILGDLNNAIMWRISARDSISSYSKPLFF